MQSGGNAAELAGEKALPPQSLPEELKVPSKSQPWPVRLMIQELKRGMFIRLPVIDTDPNRGVTYGVMPIWVIQNSERDRIVHIHAPSLTYNKTFKWTPTYRYYFYPSKLSNYYAQASVSGNRNRSVTAEMEDLNFLNRGIVLGARFAYDFDASKRFFGVGPNTAETNESDYTLKQLGYAVRLGIPVFKGSPIRVNVGHRLQGFGIGDGGFDTLPDLRAGFPQHAPARYHQNSEAQFFLDYDTRDNVVTTTEGSYAQIFAGNAQRAIGSEFSYQRYRVDLRHFLPWGEDGKMVTAGRIRFEQTVGDMPFYLMPQLGGKRILRAYGDGRYVDKGLFTATLEHRMIVFKSPVAGVTTEIEIAPFVGIGSVFPKIHQLSRRYMRPVFGGAIRAIARPQVVGSLDVGVGQEGPAVFVDINYSF